MQRKLRARFGSILLTMAMLLSLLPVTAGAENEVAEVVDGQQYGTLAEAISQAPTGSVVQLLQDATEETVITIPEEKTITLDLGGHTLTLNGSTGITDPAYQTRTPYSSLQNNGSLTIQNGTIDGMGTYENGKKSDTIANKGNLTILSNATINGQAYAICHM